MNTGFQQQQPLGFTAAVRSTPSPQQAAHLHLDATRPSPDPAIPAEEKSFEPAPKR